MGKSNRIATSYDRSRYRDGGNSRIIRGESALPDFLLFQFRTKLFIDPPDCRIVEKDPIFIHDSRGNAVRFFFPHTLRPFILCIDPVF
jgi:hypothetical protein